MTERRLARLRAGRNHYALLAMDHGLTLGINVGAPRLPVDHLVDSCEPHISGIVLTYGVARRFENPCSLALVLQCFGAPSGNQRVQVASIEPALRLDAAAVSVQLDFGHPELSDRSREASELVNAAHTVDMPVMFMASGFDAGDVFSIANTVRICHELGADLIKINCSSTLLSSPSDELRCTLAAAPPVLLAGGPLTTDIVPTAVLARSAGFAGYCIGRSIFDASVPADTAQAIDQVFSNYNQPRKRDHESS